MKRVREVALGSEGQKQSSPPFFYDVVHGGCPGCFHPKGISHVSDWSMYGAKDWTIWQRNDLFAKLSNEWA